MKPKALGGIQLILALLALLFVFVEVAAFDLPVLLIVLAFLITGIHHLTEKHKE